MTIWNWLLVIGCVLLWAGCALWVARLTGEWKRREREADKREFQRRYRVGVDTW